MTDRPDALSLIKGSTTHPGNIAFWLIRVSGFIKRHQGDKAGKTRLIRQGLTRCERQTKKKRSGQRALAMPAGMDHFIAMLAALSGSSSPKQRW